MPTKFSEAFKINPITLDELGVFDAILDVDTRVFFDPALINLTSAPEFQDARMKIEKYCSDIITLLSHSRMPNDMYWKKADRMLKFQELSGTCFGYSQKGTGGNAIGRVLRQNILETIVDLIQEGATDPTLFELLGVFQEKIGCDRISDLITFILSNEVFTYTDRIVSTLHLESVTVKHHNKIFHVCLNPFNNKPLLCLPSAVLSPLPIADSFDDIDLICAENQRVRDEVNTYFDLRGRKKLEKDEIHTLIKRNPEFRQALIRSYKSYPVEPYDFHNDPAGEYIWLDVARHFVAFYPLNMLTATPESIDSVLDITHVICDQFKKLVEVNGLHELLYDSNKTPKHERAAQLLFYGIADSYCIANNIDLSRECNGGRGPVDFKLSHGAVDKVAVEVKLTSNGQLKHGIAKQLPIYMSQEQTHRAIYLIIDNGHHRALDNFYKFYNDLDARLKEKIDIIVIDGNFKPSASNA